MTTTIKARFDGKVLVPEEPVDLPTGCVLDVQVTVVEQPVKPPLMKLLEVVGPMPETGDLPRDGAAQHDHYLYGLPKKP